jgi:hypothetical protein
MTNKNIYNKFFELLEECNSNLSKLKSRKITNKEELDVFLKENLYNYDMYFDKILNVIDYDFNDPNISLDCNKEKKKRSILLAKHKKSIVTTPLERSPPPPLHLQKTHIEWTAPLEESRSVSMEGAEENKNVFPNIEKVKVNINAEVNNVQDLLNLINSNPYDDTKEYNINLRALHKIKPYLQELNNMIGMKNLKESILDQILYYIQELHKVNNNNFSQIVVNNDYMHTVIYGPPGSGKTEIAKIISKIFCNLDILKNGKFKKVVRNDLIAGYLGQTAIKTKDVINECLGGVLFIDEAYALGNNEKRDSFSKECIDTLCEALSNYKNELMVIIAGYEDELRECFFNYNRGLDSRFTWRFSTEKYSATDLYFIFLKMVKEIGWICEDVQITPSWFEKNIDYFKFNGRDIEVLLSKTKIAHSRRVFLKNIEEKTKICLCDLDNGFKMFLNNEEVSKRRESIEKNNIWKSMYN